MHSPMRTSFLCSSCSSWWMANGVDGGNVFGVVRVTSALGSGRASQSQSLVRSNHSLLCHSQLKTAVAIFLSHVLLIPAIALTRVISGALPSVSNNLSISSSTKPSSPLVYRAPAAHHSTSTKLEGAKAPDQLADLFEHGSKLEP